MLRPNRDLLALCGLQAAGLLILLATTASAVRLLIIGLLACVSPIYALAAQFQPNRTPAQRRSVLVISYSLSLLSLLILLAPNATLLRFVIWAPLVGIGPGYALLAALFPNRPFGGAERTGLSVALSLATASIGAVVIYAVGGRLSLAGWAGLMGGVTVAGSAVAAWRRRPAQPTGRAQVGVQPRQWALLGLAGLLTAVALLVAGTPLPATNIQGYTMFWALPAGDAAAPQIRLGVQSAELTSVTYRVEARAGAGLDGEIDQITLAPGEIWEATFIIPPELVGKGAIEARLYRLDQPDRVYRWVTMWP